MSCDFFPSSPTANMYPVLEYTSNDTLIIDTHRCLQRVVIHVTIYFIKIQECIVTN